MMLLTLWYAIVRTEARSLDWMALAAADVDQLAVYYRDVLGLTPVTDPGGYPGAEPAYVFDVPPGDLLLYSLTDFPCGGVHTHYAIAVTSERYDRLYARLEEDHLVEERTFGGNRSLYGFDPAGHCFEFGERDDLTTEIGSIFEIVLEVADLTVAIDRYSTLGFEPLSSTDDRPRCRLRGPFDLELWEPQLGIADARGGCHVDIGLTIDDPTAAAATLSMPDRSPERVSGYLSVRDPDGHTWWLSEPN